MSNPPCTRCGKQNPADIHTCTPTWATEADADDLLRLGELPKPLALAEALEKTMQWPLHGKAADELRRLHAENEALRESLKTEELISFRRQMQQYADQVEKDEALLRQALEALDSCDAAHPSDGGQQWYDNKAVDAAITALRERLGENT